MLGFSCAVIRFTRLSATCVVCSSYIQLFGHYIFIQVSLIKNVSGKRLLIALNGMVTMAQNPLT